MTKGIALFHIVEEALQAAGYSYEHVGGNTYHFDLISSSHTSHSAEAVIHARENVVQLFIYFDAFIPVQRHAWFREVMCTLNAKIVCGAFLIRWEDCAYPCYRLTHFFDDQTNTAQTVRKFFNRANLGLRLFEETITSLYQGGTAQQALDSALVKLDLADKGMAHLQMI